MRGVLARLPVLAAVAVMGSSTAAAATTAPSPGPGRTVLPSTLAPWTKSATDRGMVAGSSPVDARVYLAGQDPAGLAAYARAVSDPHSPRYAHYLSPAQVQQRFGATPAQRAGVAA